MFSREQVAGRVKRMACSVVGHERVRDGRQVLHFYGVQVGEWITPQTPCAIVCQRCGESIRWLVKKSFLDGKIDQVRINGRSIPGTFDGSGDYLCWPEPHDEEYYGSVDSSDQRQGTMRV